jgi:hypothetical protein
MTGTGKSVIVADLWHKSDTGLDFGLILKEGLSHAVPSTGLRADHRESERETLTRDVEIRLARGQTCALSLSFYLALRPPNCSATAWRSRRTCSERSLSPLTCVKEAPGDGTTVRRGAVHKWTGVGAMQHPLGGDQATTGVPCKMISIEKPGAKSYASQGNSSSLMSPEISALTHHRL